MRVFADTLYWVALLISQDPWRVPAMEAYGRLATPQVFTTEEVLVEVLSAVSSGGHVVREHAAAALTNDRHFAQEGFHVLIA